MLNLKNIKVEINSLSLATQDAVSNLVVIHYGNSEYNKRKVKKIKNQNWIKPQGGLWTSPVDSEFGWKDWCEAENFRDCEEGNSFKLKFKTGTKIAIIDSLPDLEGMPFQPNNAVFSITKFIDYEYLVKIGVDAIWLTANGQWKTRLSSSVNLYGWDCDTVFIMNKNCCYETTTRNIIIEKFKNKIKQTFLWDTH